MTDLAQALVLAVVSVMLGCLTAIAAVLAVSWTILQERPREAWGNLCRKTARWLNGHLVKLLSWLALPILVVEFIRSYFDANSQPNHRLILFGLILAAAVVAQYGTDLLGRLKKVGPVEFVEERFERFVPNLKLIPTLDLDQPESQELLTQELLYEYHKADLYVTHLEWSGLKDEVIQSERLHDLLFKMSVVSLYQEDWVRVADRLEFLLEISGGKFKAAEVHYRCGVAYRKWAESSQGRQREEFFQQAHRHLWKAVNQDPHHWQAYFNLANVQFDLGFYELARQSNEKVIEIRPDSADAKYNLAICYILLGNRDAALERLESIKTGDEGREGVIDWAPQDEELTPLLGDPELGPKARLFLESFDNASL